MGWLIATILLLIVASVAMIAGSSSGDDDGERMTHIVRRGNLVVSITEQGTLESSENTEIKCKVRGRNTVIWVIDSGSIVEEGDELVRLDTLFIEEQINERSKYAHWSRSGAEWWRAKVAQAKLAVPEYLEGRYVTEMMTLEKDLAIAQSNLRTAENMLDHAEMMFERGYRSELVVQERRLAVKQAKLNVDVTKTRIDVLRDYDKKMEIKTLEGDLKSFEAEFSASDERAFADAARRNRALEEFEHCVVKAPRAGMVIYPSAAAWENAPDIEEGATVHKSQVLLLMPDLSKMQVKLSVHESIVDRVETGLEARVVLPDKELEAQVSKVSEVAQPAGWWTGNVVKYDTWVGLPNLEGLKPGMSAEVEIILARHTDVLTLPVAAILETEEGAFCWVKTGPAESKPERRGLVLGDTNDLFIVVESGLEEGDEVVLNPLAFVPEAQEAALKPGVEKSEARSDAKSAATEESKAGGETKEP